MFDRVLNLFKQRGVAVRLPLCRSQKGMSTRSQPLLASTVCLARLATKPGRSSARLGSNSRTTATKWAMRKMLRSTRIHLIGR